MRGFDVGKLVDVYRKGRGNVALSPFENAPHITKEAYERAHASEINARPHVTCVTDTSSFIRQLQIGDSSNCIFVLYMACRYSKSKIDSNSEAADGDGNGSIWYTSHSQSSRNMNWKLNGFDILKPPSTCILYKIGSFSTCKDLPVNGLQCLILNNKTPFSMHRACCCR